MIMVYTEQDDLRMQPMLLSVCIVFMFLICSLNQTYSKYIYVHCTCIINELVDLFQILCIVHDNTKVYYIS